eukprot:6957448-Pyramimonas_sp.AAC.1
MGIGLRGNGQPGTAAPGSLRRAASRGSEGLRAAHDGIYHVLKVLRNQPVQPAKEELAVAGVDIGEDFVLPDNGDQEAEDVVEDAGSLLQLPGNWRRMRRRRIQP